MSDDRVYAIGIDLSIRATGVALSDGRTSIVGHDGVTNMCWADRLRVLSELAAGICTAALFDPPGRIRLRPVVVIEGLDMAQSYGAQIERSHLWCMVVSRLLQAAHVYVAPSPQVKMYATGKGSGPKAMVIDAVVRQWPQFEVGRNDNKADAAACCAIAAELAGVPLSPVTPTQLRALDKVLSINVEPTPKARKPRRLTPGLPH